MPPDPSEPSRRVNRRRQVFVNAALAKGPMWTGHGVPHAGLARTNDTGTLLTMTKTIIKALALAGVVTLGIDASAAKAATATATAKASILKQITLTKVTDLDYATIVTGAAASTVTVTPAGVRTCGVGLTCSGTATAASFTVVGTIGQIATVAVPATVSLISGANNMTSTLVSSNATLTLAATNTFTVGGVLAVGASQADGLYAGTFTATVDYQ